MPAAQHRTIFARSIVIALCLAVITGCTGARSPTAPVSPEAVASDQGFSTAQTSSPPAATIRGLPAELRGQWCMRSDATKCFDGTQVLAEHPKAFVDGGPFSPHGEGEAGYTICLEPDVQGSCALADAMTVLYFPAGVAWNCVEREVASGDWPGCEPDFTAAHDVSQPRLVIPPNHQHAQQYIDTEPMYRVGG